MQFGGADHILCLAYPTVHLSLHRKLWAEEMTFAFTPAAHHFLRGKRMVNWMDNHITQ